MNFPQNVIEAFVYDQFEQYKVKQGPKGTEICFNGPFEPDTSFRMGINVHSNLVNDFNTGYGNTFIGFVSELLDISSGEAQHYIIKTYLNYQALKDVIKPYKPEIKLIELATMNEPPGLAKITNTTEYGKLAIRFLFDKNIAPAAVKKFKVKYFEAGYYQARLYIPLYMNKQLVFFQGRDILGEERWLSEHSRHKKYRKYINPTGLQKSQMIFNYDNIQEDGEVVIVEGPLDAMTINNGVAILGNRISKAQAKKIANKKPKRIVFIPDNDPAGAKTLEPNMNTMKEIAPEIDIGYYEIDNKHKDVNEARLKEVNHNDIKKSDKYTKLKERLLKTENKSFTTEHKVDYNVLKEKIKRSKI